MRNRPRKQPKISGVMHTPRQLADALRVDISEVTEWLKRNPNVVRITKNIPRIPSYVFQSLLDYPDRLNQRFPNPPSDRIAARAIAICQDDYVMRGAGFIYFIITPDKKFVKIGTALDPVNRLCEIQVGSPYALSLHFCFPGGGDLEFRLHGVFRHYWVRGEWFTFCASIRNFIAALKLRPWLMEVSQAKPDCEVPLAEVVVVSQILRNPRLGGHRTKSQTTIAGMPDFKNLAQQLKPHETEGVI